MSTPDTSAYTTEAGTVYLQAGQSYAVTSTAPIAIIVLPEGGSSADAQLVAITEQAGGAFEFTSTVTGHGLIMANTEDSPDALVNPRVRAVFNRAPGASSSGTGGSSSSSAPTPPWVAYNADRSEITAADFTGLTEGYYMFYKTKLASFSSDLSALTNGSNMFRDCTLLASFSRNLPALTNGSSMFEGCSALDSFSSDLSALTTGSSMFRDCTALRSFSGDLDKMTNGIYMFRNCTSLRSFSGDLSALEQGNYMFDNCRVLYSFDSNLSALETGTYMFYYCFALTNFSSDLSSLTAGKNMFSGCVLNKESTLRILNTLPTYTSGTHQLTLGMNASLEGDVDISAALTSASNKLWTVTVEYNLEPL